MEFRFSTDDVPERQRFAFWADSLTSSIGTQRLPVAGAAAPFQASFSGRSIGSMFNTRAEADAHHILRQKHDIARRPWGAYWIYREAGAGMWCKYDRREFVSRTGDMFISDADLPFETQTSTRYAYESWLIPKTLLDPFLPNPRQPLMRRLDHAGGGVDALAVTYLEALTRNVDSIPEAAIWPLVDTMVRLLGVACGAATMEHADAVRLGRLVEAKRYIDHNLASTELSTASVAGSLGISIRTLHELFEPADVSFARHVLRRRLEECRKALLGDPERAVTDIAFAWGFNSLSTFYRTFQTAFGMSPSDSRAAERDARRS